MQGLRFRPRSALDIEAEGAVWESRIGRAALWGLGIGVIAVLLASINLVGGFVVTDRMLEMFGGRKVKAPKPARKDDA